MKHRLFTALGLLFFVAAACQMPAGLPKIFPSAANPQDAAYVFAANPSPTRVEVKLDTTHSSAALVPLTGGKLSVQGKDGTTYTLDIPANALTAETTVTMTPVDSLNGLPFGKGQPLAVQLGPEGLFFNNFATLTITPTKEIPIDQQIMFSYQGSGQDVIIAPPVVDSREIKIRLLHFSGYGVTQGLLADLAPVRARIGGDAERRLQSLAAERIGAERQRQLLGSGGDANDFWGEFNDLFTQYEDQVVKPRIAAAGESCAAGRLAMQTYLGFERQKQLVGSGGDGGTAQLIALMDIVGPVCLKEEYQMCAQDHIIHRMIPVWLGIERQYALLGSEESGAGAKVVAQAKELTRKCLTFDLQFESQGVFDDGGNGGYDSSVTSKVKLRFNPDDLKMSADAPLVNTAFTFKISDCTVTSNRGGGTFNVINMGIVPDKKSPTDELGYVRDFKLNYFPGKTSESFSVKCPDQGAFNVPSAPLWTGIYIVLHYPTEFKGDQSAPAPAQPGMDLSGGANPMASFNVPDVPPGTGFIVSDWEIFGKEYFAKKEWIKEDKGLGITERGTFKLYHRPGQ